MELIANWLWNHDNNPANTWMCFRKSFVINNPSQDLEAAVSVDSKYWLWINGKLVVFEGGLNRGPEPGAGYFDTINIGKYLVNGRNTIAALVWYWGNSGRNNVDSGQGGFLFQTKSPRLALISDNTWKTKVHPGYYPTAEPNPSYLYGGHNLGFDARQDIPGWHKPVYDDTGWENATEKGKAGIKPWGNLSPRPIPLWKDYGLKKYCKTFTKKTGNKLVVEADLPYAAHITPFFRIKSKTGGLSIDIRTDRYEVHGGPGDDKNVYKSHRVEYLTKPGIQEFEAYDWLFGEKVIFTFPDEVEILNLKFRETGYNVDFEGRFNCNDKFINKLYDKCSRTLYICMRDNYMDCPDRERGQWIGDVSSQIPQTFYALGRPADLLTKKAIHDFINWKNGDILRGNIPGTKCSELPSQSLNAISEIGMIMTYYLHSGDKSVLVYAYESIKKYILLWKLNADGSVIPRNGNWAWFDHGINVDRPVLENAWYLSALKSANTIAELTGNRSDCRIYGDRISVIQNNFDKLYWKDDGYRSGESNDDRANALAVLSGLVDKSKYEHILKIFLEVNNSTPYMEGYVLEAMFKMGYGKHALTRMRERYGKLVKNSNTTLWEDFFVLGTKNHAWSGAPLTIISKYIAGIFPATPGYETFYVLPQLFDLKSLSIKVPSVKGDIEVEIINNTSKYSMKLTSPVGTKAIVGIPKNLSPKIRGQIKINGSVVSKKGIVDEDNGYVMFTIPSGKHIISQQ
ncbi:MAG: alpha-L-rhamnosidase C-terminal domain-containing protein [Elusimicrobiota bacterium]